MARHNESGTCLQYKRQGNFSISKMAEGVDARSEHNIEISK